MLFIVVRDIPPVSTTKSGSIRQQSLGRLGLPNSVMFILAELTCCRLRTVERVVSLSGGISKPIVTFVDYMMGCISPSMGLTPPEQRTDIRALVSRCQTDLSLHQPEAFMSLLV